MKISTANDCNSYLSEKDADLILNPRSAEKRSISFAYVFFTMFLVRIMSMSSDVKCEVITPARLRGHPRQPITEFS